jgi:hypothetical protein
MSYLDPDSLTDDELLARYILDRRNRGFFLRRSEYGLIRHWLKLAGEVEAVIICLEQVLSDRGMQEPPAIELVHGSVVRKLKLLGKTA